MGGMVSIRVSSSKYLESVNAKYHGLTANHRNLAKKASTDTVVYPLVTGSECHRKIPFERKYIHVCQLVPTIL